MLASWRMWWVSFSSGAREPLVNSTEKEAIAYSMFPPKNVHARHILYPRNPTHEYAVGAAQGFFLAALPGNSGAFCHPWISTICWKD